MAGVYYGAVFGGSTSSILLNTPGEASTVATSFDGYPLAQAGKAGKALATAAYSSFSGGTIGAVFLLLAAPALAVVSLSFRSADYFALMVMGLTAVSAFTGKGQFLKAGLMTIVGVMLSTIGTDDSTGIQRFTLGQLDLIDGISFLLLAMATFALSEALISALKPGETSNAVETAVKEKFGSLKVSKQEFKEIAPSVGRSSVLGFLHRSATRRRCHNRLVSSLRDGTSTRKGEGKTPIWEGELKRTRGTGDGEQCGVNGFVCAVAHSGDSGFWDNCRDVGCTDFLRGAAGAPAVCGTAGSVLVSDCVNVFGKHCFVDSELAFDPLYRPATRCAETVSRSVCPFLFADRCLLGLFQ